MLLCRLNYSAGQSLLQHIGLKKYTRPQDVSFLHSTARREAQRADWLRQACRPSGPFPKGRPRLAMPSARRGRNGSRAPSQRAPWFDSGEARCGSEDRRPAFDPRPDGVAARPGWRRNRRPQADEAAFNGRGGHGWRLHNKNDLSRKVYKGRARPRGLWPPALARRDAASALGCRAAGRPQAFRGAIGGRRGGWPDPRRQRAPGSVRRQRPGVLAGGLGFEPRLTESESAVLPLDDPPRSERPSGDGRWETGIDGISLSGDPALAMASGAPTASRRPISASRTAGACAPCGDRPSYARPRGRRG